MHCAGPAKGLTAAKLRARQAKHVAQNPQQRYVAVDIRLVLDAIDLDFEGHGQASFE